MQSTVFEIGGEKFDVVKKGFDQAQQVIEVARWLNKYGAQAAKVIQGQAESPEGNEEASQSGYAVIGRVIETIPPEALVELFALIFGCPVSFAMENFDISLLVDGMITVYDNQPAIKRITERFFSSNTSSGTTQESSMK